MKHKRYLLVVLVAFFVLIGVCFVIVILQSEMSQLSNNPISYPTSFPLSYYHSININQNKYVGFKYSVITSDDNLELLNEAEEKLIISLDKRQWKSITWCPNGTLVAALGKDDANNYDLYIYDLAKQELVKATSFDSFGVGVDSYTWIDNSNILFMQGVNPERWLHKFNYQSSSILKLVKLSGNIVSSSQDLKYLIMNDKNSLTLIDDQGNLITNLNQYLDETGNKIVPSNITISRNDDKILINSVNGLYKAGLTDRNAVKLNFTLKYNLICDLDEDHFISTSFDPVQSTFEIDNIDVKNILSSNIVLQGLSSVTSFDFIKSNCNNGTSLLFKSNQTDSSVFWYRINGSSLEELFILRGMKEVSLADKQSLFILN